MAVIREGVGAMVAVESDPVWIEALRRHPEVAGAVDAGRLGLVHGDVGPVGPLGCPRDHGSEAPDRGAWPNYIRAGWRETSRRGMCPTWCMSMAGSGWGAA